MSAPITRPRQLSRLGLHTSAEHPSLGRSFEAPKWEWQDEELVDRYEASFDVWTADGTSLVIDKTGATAKEVPFWVAVKKHAIAVFGRNDVVAGWDYALTETVHCKSTDEIGVDLAKAVCGPLYLPRVLEVSSSSVVVVLGSHARNTFRSVFGYADPGVVSKPLNIAGRRRQIVFLAHPSARRARYPKNLSGDELQDVRRWLAKRTSARADVSAGGTSTDQITED